MYRQLSFMAKSKRMVDLEATRQVWMSTIDHPQLGQHAAVRDFSIICVNFRVREMEHKYAYTE